MDTHESPARLRCLTSWLLMQAAQRAGRLAAGRMATLGVSKATYPALATLSEFGPSSQAELGRRLGIDRKDVSALAVELELTGVVKRSADPEDMRRNRLAITAEGRALLRRLDAAFAGLQEDLLAGLSAEERAVLARLLSVISSP